MRNACCDLQYTLTCSFAITQSTGETASNLPLLFPLLHDKMGIKGAFPSAFANVAS